MNDTFRHMARVLGAHGVEGAGHDARFMVDGPQGGKLKVSLEGDVQRIMATLADAAGITRATIDVAPVAKAVEDPATPGRVTLHVGGMMIHIDSRPSLAIEIVSKE